LIPDALAQEFLEICQETMGFLKSYGFSKGRLTVDPAVHQVTVRFHGKTLVIECIWDVRDEGLQVKVARLEEGNPPTDFAVDSRGRRVRDDLLAILMRKGVRGFGYRKLPKGVKPPQLWRSILEDDARLLQQDGQAILREEEVLD